MALKDCCLAETQKSLRKHRDVATCDACNRLLLAYGDEETYRLTVDELEDREIGFDTGIVSGLRVVAKQR